MTTAATRPAAVAGRFYPLDPGQLRRSVEDLLAEAPAWTGPAPKALIAPHAGYVYSGPIAASAYACWIPERETIRKVVLLGPAHYVEVPGLALPTAEEFATPLGSVPVDQEAVSRISALPQVVRMDVAHAREHSLEVQLPFLQVVLNSFSIVPLAVGHATAAQVAGVLQAIWGGPETRVVISSDLSHFLDWASARELDETTARAIETLDGEAIRPEQACGQAPIRGLLRAAAEQNLAVRRLDLRNSGDTAGDRSRVVGYGAFAFGA